MERRSQAKLRGKGDVQESATDGPQTGDEIRQLAEEDAQTEDRFQVDEEEVSKGRKRMWRRRRIIVIVGVSLSLVAGIAMFLYNATDMANTSTQIHLRILGSGVYEYHAKTGQWPTRIDDLAQTSVTQARYWKSGLEDEVYVIVWPTKLEPDPKDNADVIVAYHNKGLLAELGRKWVCWGDLRTKYIKTKDLRDRLQKDME